MHDSYDYLVIGSGMAGLTAAALLAKSGHRVCVLEAHEYPGGCAHSFPMGDYTFCAAVHYVFYCGEGEPIYNFLKKLGLHEQVTFERLDPEGYDHFSCPTAGVRFRIPNGLDKWTDRLIDRYPQQRQKLVEFFRIVRRLITELRQMPFHMTWKDFLAAPRRFPTVLKYRRWTLQRLFDRLELPQEVQAVLATQLGDIGLPPSQVSLVVYTALIWSYGSGAYHPTRHFQHFVEKVADVIDSAPGCRIEYEAEVSEIHARSGRIEAVRTRDGRTFSARTCISNMDPRACIDMIGREHFPPWFLKKVSYDYSVSSYTIFLGIRGLDLRDYGFGNWNVWHYPHLDINQAYRAQVEGNDLSDPWMFLSTPTLMSQHPDAPVCPDGDQILEVVTVCGYDYFRAQKDGNRSEYNRLKKRITDRFLDILETHYIPGLKEHIVMKVSGTPATNGRYLWAPQGNIYGSALTPANVDFSRLKYHTPIENLFFTGASAEFPSVGATVVGGSRLYTHLTGDPVNPGRDTYGLW